MPSLSGTNKDLMDLRNAAKVEQLSLLKKDILNASLTRPLDHTFERRNRSDAVHVVDDIDVKRNWPTGPPRPKEARYPNEKNYSQIVLGELSGARRDQHQVDKVQKVRDLLKLYQRKKAKLIREMPSLSPKIKRDPLGPVPKDREEAEVLETKKNM